MEGERHKNGHVSPVNHGPPAPEENGTHAEPAAEAWDGGAVSETEEMLPSALSPEIATEEPREPITVPWERSALPPDGRDGRFRRRRARLLQSRHARIVPARSYRREIRIIVTMD